MTNRTVLACGILVALSLYFVYGFATALFLQHLQFSSVDLLESLIIVTLAARIVGIVGYYRSRPAKVEVLLILLSLEVFVVMALVASFFITQDVAYSNLAHTIFSTWVADLFVVLPSYIVFAGAVQMFRGRGLVAVLVSLALEFGFLSFAASTMLVYGGTFTFSNFFDFLLAAAKTDIASGLIPGLSSVAILVPSVAFYCSLLVYATVTIQSGRVIPRVSYGLPFIGTTIALCWVYLAFKILPNTLLSFTAPGLLLVVLLWAFMRR